MAKRGVARKGLSDIITVILIILIVLAAIILIWAFLRNTLYKAGSQIDSSIFTTSLTIPRESVRLNETQGNLTLAIKREQGAGNMAAFVIVLEDINGKKVPFRYNESLNELQTTIKNIDYSSSGLGLLRRVSVVPFVYNKDGLELQGKNEYIYTVRGDEGTISPPSPPIPPSIICTVDSNCTDGNLNTQDSCINPGSTTSYCEYKNSFISYWNFDDNAFDQVGNNDGALQGGIGYETCQVGTGSALRFDGINDYVSIIDSNEFDFAKNNFTISFWAYPTSFSGYNGIISGSRYGSWVCENGWSVYTHDTGRIDLSVDCAGSELATSGLGKMTINAWNHVVITRKGIGLTDFDVYVNAVNGGSPSNGNVNINTASGQEFIIGRYYAAQVNEEGHYFDGVIDEVKIWSRSLTVAEISGLYNLGDHCEI